MNLIPVKTPKWLKGIFPKYIWNMPSDQKVLYLTFDDGPTPDVTEWTLEILKTYKAKATFFCIGNNIAQHPELFHKIVSDGHAIGNHTYHHPNGWFTKTSTYVNEVNLTEELINKQINKLNKTTALVYDRSHKIIRPPYGKITNRQAKELMRLQYKVIMWDILAFDWKSSLSKENCAANVISKARPGSIIVFHDSVKAEERMKFALRKTLEHFSKEGYLFKSIY